MLSLYEFILSISLENLNFQIFLLAFSLRRATCCLRYSIIWSASAPFCSNLFRTASLVAIFAKKRQKLLNEKMKVIHYTVEWVSLLYRTPWTSSLKGKTFSTAIEPYIGKTNQLRGRNVNRLIPHSDWKRKSIFSQKQKIQYLIIFQVGKF